MDPLREVDRCKGKRKDGQRCTRRTGKTGPLCWQHTRSALKVDVKKSALPGMGLFAHKRLKKGEVIPHQPYRKDVAVRGTSSRVYSKREAERRYPGNTLIPYGIAKTRGRVRDDCRTNAGVVRYANHRTNPNAILTAEGNIKTKRAIPAGGEIFVSYGSEYWKSYNAMTPEARRKALEACKGEPVPRRLAPSDRAYKRARARPPAGTGGRGRGRPRPRARTRGKAKGRGGGGGCRGKCGKKRCGCS